MTNFSETAKETAKKIIFKKLDGLLTVNKREILNEVEEKTGESIRYRSVRDEIEDIIYDMADKLELDLEKSFSHNSDGSVYVEFIPYEHDIEDDDSDIYYEDETCDESDYSNTELNEYATIKSAGRIFITNEMRNALNIPYADMYIKRDYNNHKIVISSDYHADRDHFKLINLRYSQINVANVLGLLEGDAVKITRVDDTIVIEPAK